MTLPFPAYQGSDPYIFVSYDHASADLVYRELEWIRTAGFNVWYDEGIGPGHSWPEELAKAIEQCALFLFFVTPNSVDSRNCHREINYALSKDKAFLAVHLVDTDLPSGLALEIGDRQAIYRSKFSKTDYQAKVEQALSEFIGRSDAALGTNPAPVVPQPPKKKWPRLLAIGASAGVLVAAGVWWLTASNDQNSARQLERWQSAVANEDTLEAYRIGQQLDLTAEQWQAFSLYGELTTDPAGANVAIAPYLQQGITEPDWIEIGQTPLQIRWPLGGYRVRIEKPGFRSLEMLLLNPSSTLGNSYANPWIEDSGTIPLIEEARYPGDMVYVPAGHFVPMVVGFGIGPDLVLEHGAFLIDRYEVTNRQYQEFVDANGYSRREFWAEMPGVDDEDAREFDELMAQFVDTTGKPAPAGWEFAAYPLGMDDHPVSGVSWYEAAAFARFSNKQLPALAYWARAAYTPHGGGIGTNDHSAYIVPVSNFSADAAKQVRELKGLSASGTYGQAGNVREWMWNAAGDRRWLIGGAVGDEPYMATTYNAVDPRDRDLGNGFRLMRYLDDPNPALLAEKSLRGKSEEDYVPVSDEVFATFKEQYQYSRANLDPIELVVDESNSEWILRKVSLRTGYDDSRFDVHIIELRIKTTTDTVVFFSGAGAVAPQPNSFKIKEAMLAIDFILKSGRTVVIPELYESYSRSTKYMSSADGVEFRQWLLNWHSDLGRTLDYLQSRSDDYGQSYHWLGVSYGASLQLPLLAIEKRFNDALLIMGGISQSKASISFSEALHYVPRIDVPVLFIGGQQDSVFPVKYSQDPFEVLIGNAAEFRRVSYDGPHSIPPRKLMVREVINWLDRHSIEASVPHGSAR